MASDADQVLLAGTQDGGGDDDDDDSSNDEQGRSIDSLLPLDLWRNVLCRTGNVQTVISMRSVSRLAREVVSSELFWLEYVKFSVDGERRELVNIMVEDAPGREWSGSSNMWGV